MNDTYICTGRSNDERRTFLIHVTLAIAVAFLASGLTQQLAHPFLRHDDLDYLIKPGEPFAGDLLRKVLNEGRWLNYLWYLSVSQNMGMEQVYAAFLVGMVAISVGLVWSIRSPAVAALLIFALFLSTPMMDLSLWAATLAPGLLIASIAVFALHSRANPILVMLVALPLLLHTYPPFSQLLLFAYIVKSLDRPFTEIFKVTVAYLIGYALGIASIYVINYAYFGYPGVLIEEWRQPNPARSISDVVENLGKLWLSLEKVGIRYSWLVGLGVVGLSLTLGLRSTRRPAGLIAGYVAVMLSIETALTTMTGVASFTKSYLWVWPAALFPWALLAMTDRNVARVSGFSALLFLCVFSWAGSSLLLADGRRAIEYDDYLARTAQSITGTPRPHVILYGDPRHAPDLAHLHVSRQVNKYLWLRYRMHVTECTPEKCASIAERISKGDQPPFRFNDGVAFVFAKDGWFYPYDPAPRQADEPSRIQ